MYLCIVFLKVILSFNLIMFSVKINLMSQTVYYVLNVVVLDISQKIVE